MPRTICNGKLSPMEKLKTSGNEMGVDSEYGFSPPLTFSGRAHRLGVLGRGGHDNGMIPVTCSDLNPVALGRLASKATVWREVR